MLRINGVSWNHESISKTDVETFVADNEHQFAGMTPDLREQHLRAVHAKCVEIAAQEQPATEPEKPKRTRRAKDVPVPDPLDTPDTE